MLKAVAPKYISGSIKSDGMKQFPRFFSGYFCAAVGARYSEHCSLNVDFLSRLCAFLRALTCERRGREVERQCPSPPAGGVMAGEQGGGVRVRGQRACLQRRCSSGTFV